MLKQHPFSPKTAAHRRQLLVREALSLLAITFVALLLQAGGHQIPVLVLDGSLISAGMVGLLVTIFLGNKPDRWWFLALSAIAMIAGAAQLFWSSGVAVGFLVLVAALPVADALANLLVLARGVWLDLHASR